VSKHTYEVVVGNVGTVYNGPSLDEAEDWYDSYARASEREPNHTRVAGEDVTLFKDGEPVKEHIGLGGLREEWAARGERLGRSKHRRQG